jgi:hypothetical protein
MNSTASITRRFAARLLSALVLLLLVESFAPASAEGTDAPHIAGCRVGFNGLFKVGHWTPVWVNVAGVTAERPTIELTAIDSDGVDVTISAASDETHPTLLYTRLGRLSASIHLRLVSADGRLLDHVELEPGHQLEGGGHCTPLPATGQIVLQIGPGTLGLKDVLEVDDTAEGTATGGVSQIIRVDSLPPDWFGYEAVDVAVLTTSDGDFCRQLTDDSKRFAALREWLELGGRLVVSAGRTAPQLLAPDKPLASLVPGKISELLRLPQTQALENFAGSGDAISQSGAQQNIPLPRLVDIQGRVELYGRGSELPILVRAAHGLGQLVFLGVDPSESPLAEWNGRRAFLKAVLKPYLFRDDTHQAKQKLVSLGYDDLAGALRQRLGRSFVGVSMISFPWVAALVIGYLLWLGPLDYLLVDRVARRPTLAWLTLPVILAVTCGGAALLAGAAKRTDGTRLNHAELVDFDVTTGRTRGIGWATLYSPKAGRFDVTLEPRLPADRPPDGAQTLVSWSGLPGSGLGGMHAAGEPLDVTGVGYRQTSNLTALDELPVLTASTKSLLARWDCPPKADSPPKIAADLAVDDNGLLVGSIMNNTAAMLADAYLLHGRWGYRLGDLPPAEKLTIGPQLHARGVQSIVTGRAHAAPARDTFLADRASVDELLSVMMFYQAIGGEGFAGLPNRYQASCDLSPLLTLDRAILVARGTTSGSQWTNTTTRGPLGTEPDASTVIYRFILPLHH